jgi:arylsulfatase A-like enzyme
MAAMISAVDDGVGEIVKALKQAGTYNNTVIFFCSDNGPSTESRNWLDGTEDFYYGGSTGVFRGHKASLFEGGIRMPAILSAPGRIPAGQICDKTAIMMDIFPTFLEMAGSKTNHPIDGVSILPIVTGNAPAIHSDIMWEYNGQLAIRRGKWKLVLNGWLDFKRRPPDAVHLSDLESDPGEKVNLAEKEPALVADLKNALKTWTDSLGK